MAVKFKNCIILASDEHGEYQVLREAVLCVKDNTIAYIGSENEAPYCEEIKDMGGAILMPGIVNAHGHGPMTLLRGIGGGLALQEWLETAIFPVEERLESRDIEAGERWAVMEMLAGGTTCVSEMYDFPGSMGKVLLESGMKGNISRVGLSFSETEEIPRGRFDECIGFLKEWNDPEERVIAELCLHSEYLTNEKFVRRIAEANHELKRNVNVHVSETRREHEECKVRHNGLTPIQYLNNCGLFEENTYCAHCVWVEDADIEIMHDKKVTAVFNPTSNCKLASGFARIDNMKKAGVNVAIGTDGVASNNNLNMFEEIHIASLLIKNCCMDATKATAEEILKMATVNGAKALGRTDTGEIKVGKKADIIAVSMDKPHMFPAFDIPNILVYSAQASDVIMTMVDGRILYEKGEYLTIDAERAKTDMQASLDRIYSRNQ